jgi:hypothetical protein
MAKPIEQVEQDLTQLSAASSQLGRELMAAYQSYFLIFASTLKKQSIQGCYYLCTTCYPEPFLKLNYTQRSQLLKTLQRVIGNVIGDLVIHLNPDCRTNSNNDDEPTGELTASPVMPINWFATPTSLSNWQQNLEEELNHSLKEISYKVNLLLQQAQVMPASIPKPILEASDQADRQGESTANIPNILSVLIEQDINEKELQLEDLDGLDELSDSPQIVQIYGLYLRLIEIEFSDVTVLSLRKNISQLINKTKVLRREYLQKQQELKIAQAESAWRNSWFESP